MDSRLCGLLFVVVAVALGNVINTPLENGGQHWAVLVAGSNTWMNYRHQADVCHAYQVMKDHGIPEENIIVMMYDDIAHNEENPTPGEIINRPMGHDVYKGVKIDYKGRDVTPEVFLAVITGNKDKVANKGTGRVLGSGKNDHVFINFVDHGAPGLVAFPSSELHAREFMDALKQMYNSKMYQQMVIYIEACESGSMFQNLLPENIRIFATTAANSRESSYATYYDELRRTYLGDLYSVKWMEDSDVKDLNSETLAEQFKRVKAETNMSHVQEFGDMKISQEPVGDFQGNTPSNRNIYYPKIHAEPVASQDVGLAILQKKADAAETVEEKHQYHLQMFEELEFRQRITAEMKTIVSLVVNHEHALTGRIMSDRSDDFNFDCYEPAVRYYSHKCRKLSAETYALRVLYALQNLCNLPNMSTLTITSAMDKVCV